MSQLLIRACFDIQQITRNLVAADYERVHLYAHRIRRISEKVQGRTDYTLFLSMHAQALQTLELCNPHRYDGPLVPKVHHLVLSLGAFHRKATIPWMVVGSALRSIRLTSLRDWYEREQPIPHEILQNMTSVLSSATITSFILHAELGIHFLVKQGLADFGIQPNLLSLYCTFHHLEEFNARSTEFTHQTLSHFAALPTLWKLMVSIQLVELRKFIKYNSSRAVFDQLIALHFEVDTLESAHQLLECRGFRALQELQISRHPISDTIWNVDPLISTLRGHAGDIPLTSLKLMQAEYLIDHVSLSPSEISTVIPLFALADITTIEIKLMGTIGFGSDELQALAQAWLRLEVLQLFEYTTAADDTQIFSFSDLFPVVASCLNLRKLTIHVNALKGIPDAAQMTDMAPGLRLEYFDVSRSPACDPVLVSDFIRRLFPNLQKMNNQWAFDGDPHSWSFQAGEEEYFECWVLVEILLGLRPGYRIGDVIVGE